MDQAFIIYVLRAELLEDKLEDCVEGGLEEAKMGKTGKKAAALCNHKARELK